MSATKELSFEWDSAELEFWRAPHLERALTRAVSRAGGDAIRFLKVGSSRLVRQRKRFRVARVNSSLPLDYPGSKAHLNDLEWRMDVSGKVVPVSDFPYRQTRRGVSVAINGGKRTLIPSAFVARTDSGHVGVFLRALSAQQGPLTKRQTRLGQRFRAARLPIEHAVTTRISDVFEDQGFIPFVQTGAQVRFSATFQRLMRLELEKER